ncbi:MAG: VCBS repeat-containing protein, partial [Deltaproteobacteria bacterium]|nr:VCBS repeat-containing protein [Deltaproteobacteria bacterium]
MTIFARVSIIILLVACTALASPEAGLTADRPLKILVLPFKINAAQDLTYIQEGILDMIGSRLTWEGRIVILERIVARQAFEQVQGRINEQIARELGLKTGANYVLYGSLTVVGQSISLDAKIISQLEKKPGLAIHTQSKNLDGIIPKVNAFVEDINDKIFERTAQPVYTAKKEPPPLSRRHPESLLTRSKDQGIFRTTTAFPGGKGFWRSPSLPVTVTGLDVGDVDGDNRNEIVYSSLNKVFVARFEEGRFRRLAVFEGYKNDHFITLDVADVNGNGRAEIFVNNRIHNETQSYVLEYVNGRLVPILKESPWYFRVLNLPSGPILIGQEGASGRLFYGMIYRMIWQGRNYVPQEALNLPRRKVNILNFGLLRFSGQEKESLAVIDESEYLHIMTRTGRALWEGEEQFGGSVVYLKPVSGDTDIKRAIDKIYYYIPPRILTADSDDDGHQEIIIARSTRSAISNIVPSLRGVSSGAVYSLTFNQMSLTENWRSPVLGGYPVDYQIKDY